MQQNLVNLTLSCPEKQIASLFLETISLMGKRFVQNEWPSLIPELISNLQKTDNIENTKRALEAIKKICKKYRYMFRSDDLYTEMNYMIENLSTHLISNLFGAIQSLQACLNKGPEALEEVKVLLSVVNSVLHIIESILS